MFKTIFFLKLKRIWNKYNSLGNNIRLRQKKNIKHTQAQTSSNVFSLKWYFKAILQIFKSRLIIL